MSASPDSGRERPPVGLRWWQRWHTNLLGAFLFVAIVVLVAQIADVARDYEQAETAALASQRDSAVALSRATRLFVDRYLTGTEVVAEALALRGAGDAAALRPLLERLRREHADVAALALDGMGRVVASAPAGLEGQDLAGRDVFRTLSSGAASVITTVAPRVPVLVVGSAARGPDGRLHGVVAATIPAAALGDELRVQLSGEAQALVVDRDGFVLVHGGHPELDWSRRDFSGVPLVAEALTGRAAHSRGYRSPLDGQLSMGAMVPIDRIGWAAGVVQPAWAALAPARRERAATLWVAASVLLLSVAMALVLSAWLYRPIERLAAGAAAFARGEFGHRIRVRERNELGWLADRFNEMASRLARTTTRLHEALDEARADRGRLATTLESIPDGVLVCDAGGRLVLANEAARRLLGDDFAPGARLEDAGAGLVARSLDGAVIAPSDGPLQQALSGRSMHDVRLAITRPDGVRYVSATAAAVDSGTGERLGAVAVLRDVTGQQALQSLKDQFIARASHELRTPLTAIRGTLGFLRRSAEPGLEATPRELLRIAARNADQMMSLIEELLDASRLSSGTVRLTPEPVDAAHALERVAGLVRPLAVEAGVGLDVRADAGLVLDADPRRLDQVLVNLLGNAVKFTKAGGRVQATVRQVDAAVEFRVSDQGVGLAREHLERVFEPFYQVDHPVARGVSRGSGLGLTIARSLVELHRGMIWAESPGRGQGSTFVVRLPGPHQDGAEADGMRVTS